MHTQNLFLSAFSVIVFPVSLSLSLTLSLTHVHTHNNTAHAIKCSNYTPITHARISWKNWAQNKGVAVSRSSSGLTWHWPALQTKMEPDSSFCQMSIYVTNDAGVEARALPPSTVQLVRGLGFHRLCLYIWKHTHAQRHTKYRYYKHHVYAHTDILSSFLHIISCWRNTSMSTLATTVDCICTELLCMEKSQRWRGRVMVWKSLILPN